MSNDQRFKALVVEETGDGGITRGIRERRATDLPAGDVLVRVRYSSLNYKDALSATGNRGVTRRYPHTPGIDAAGVVEESADPAFSNGDAVIVTSYDLGMNTPGGFGQLIRVPAGWVVPLPAGLSLREAMVLGTAGLTAAMSVNVLAAKVSPDGGDILVTGATGGVGTMAVAILARLGYPVVAVTGKPEAVDYLSALGARATISREEAAADDGRPLASARWAGVVDTVGGEILTAAIKATRPFGVVTCCGMVASPELDLTVFPFILRGVTLAGINSQEYPMERRRVLWDRLAGPWKPAGLDALARDATLEELDGLIDTILHGGITGRVVVSLEGRG